MPLAVSSALRATELRSAAAAAAMSDRDSFAPAAAARPGAEAEKVLPVHESDAADVKIVAGPAFASTFQEEDFWTRNGLNLRSFQRRHYGAGVVELDRAMKTRHLHMIAIGGSIGAGFFVGSGGALSKGVSVVAACAALRLADAVRQGPASVLICFCVVGFMVFNVGASLAPLFVCERVCE